MPRDINELKERIAANVNWTDRLTEALTHRSYAVENSLPYDNQRLEFLGDAVLEIVLTEHLFRLYPDSDEGAMTKMRSALVREEALAKLARGIGLGDYILLGKGEQESGGNNRDSTLADLFEAVLGALYLDGGYEIAKEFLLVLFKQIYDDPRSLLSSLNPKGLLQEFSQQRWGVAPAYAVLRTSGPEHLPVYEVEVSLLNYVAIGRAASRKQAESAAAKTLYFYLTEKEAKNEL